MKLITLSLLIIFSGDIAIRAARLAVPGEHVKAVSALLNQLPSQATIWRCLRTLKRAANMPLFLTRLLAVVVAVMAVAPVQAEDMGPVARIKDDARRQFESGMDVVRGIYRKRIADLINSPIPITRVEVLLLDFSMGKEQRTQPVLGSFGLGGFKSTPVLASHTCTEKEREELLPVLSTAVGGLSHPGGTLCHFPVHGVRVWIGDELAFETSICWYCGNFLMPYDSSFMQENHTDGFEALKPVLMKLMPIPDDEIARFKKGHDAGPDGK